MSLNPIARAFGNPSESIRSSIEQSLPVGHEPGERSEDMPLAHASKRIVAYAAEESRVMRHRKITSAHLLLGIHRESRGRQAGIPNLFKRDALPEAVILIEYGADYDALRTRITES